MSTALVPFAVGKACLGASPGPVRPRADFLAHLIATAAQDPQTRTRRRADPAEAVAVYAAIERSGPARCSTVSCSL